MQFEIIILSNDMVSNFSENADCVRMSGACELMRQFIISNSASYK